MTAIKIPTSFNIHLDFEIPPFHKRLLAWIIDLFIQIFYLIIAHKIYNKLYDNSGSSFSNPYDTWAIGLMIILPFFIYHVVMEITMNGQSIGKKILHLRVVNENGGKASISQFIIRWLIRTSDYMILMVIIYAPLQGPYILYALLGSILLLITDVTMVTTSDKGQRIGDLLAHTIVISTYSRKSMDDTIFLEVPENYIPLFPQIMQLSDRDINSIKHILDSANKSGDFELAEMASEKIKNHLKISTSLSPFEFLAVLLKDYNYLSVN
ncbi:MAG: RDD family protein [Chitinophagaceae bacterium]|jgi:uncharacterized RDD family membrane protein YckC|nr:RDD family protein [Chitinophagaceae bacterium]